VDEGVKRTWDVRLGITGSVLTVFATLTTVAGILVGIQQFNSGQRHNTVLQNSLLVEKDRIEFKRRLWLERLNVYRAVAESAGKVVARLDDPEKLKEAAREFLALYWGAMILVEEKPVERAMIDFMLELRDLQSGWTTPNRVKTRADELLKACRKSAESGAPQS
jgi:hypothetical protein